MTLAIATATNERIVVFSPFVYKICLYSRGNIFF